MRRFFYENSLSIVLFTLFFVCVAGQAATGFRVYNQDQREHGQPTVDFASYLWGGHFIEAVFENWESEFLQMGAYVVLTVFLRQKGSAESKKLDEPEAEDRSAQPRPDAPWPVKRGGWVRRLYENSLSLALLVLFALSFALHAAGGAAAYNQERQEHGESPVSTLRYIGTSRFWFESFQNWQSEFLSVGVLVVLSIFLRQRGSPESKPVDSPHAQTGKG
ncbi:DUF6766 family protein [Pyrinomonas methylaliphatogenes]|uniref:Transmembrane protein n=1 Tax=Pyrinomonas methylaliphatogenes TaxID=454194 RepID=A0A0B6X001_9BACT|nr:DUF6766 family protein [Pyrinomonas methylaliphatogenes]MBX5477926.1 hypothetical protein [Pyrinomonas methylaliphatogenes]CDM66646.1 hypothetical protein PYK22_02679 [Pyrinomonas methylaliphatogenes]